MDRKSKLLGVAIAAAAISLAALPLTSAIASTKVNCYGVNSCKGHGQCKTAKNACKGQNTCKGQGFVKMSAAKCTKAKGTTTEPAAEPATQPAS